jgi:magnesium chelatase accessory protein
MCIDSMIHPQHLISVNGALLPLRGIQGELFSPIAKLLSRSSLVPRLFAWRAARPEVLDRLLDGTGSRIDAAGRQLYRTLIGNADHASAALKMMANWDLRPLERDLPKMAPAVCLTLVCGENDRTVPPQEANRVKALVPAARIVRLPGLGHLAHEEQPSSVDDIVEQLPFTSGIQS